MITVTDPESITRWADEKRAAGRRIGFVPTMGFLHAGHTSLMERLRPEVDELVVSIFVNPLQFGPKEDLARYPRDPEGDALRCAKAGVDCLFTMESGAGGAFYPDGFSTHVAVAGLTEGLCGASRPGHFDGVTTVVARLFGLVRCHVACFGEKDWQQLAVIRRMVRDLALPVQIVGGPLIRDADGLALSSRNAYLRSDARARALSLHKALFAMRDAAAAGTLDAAALRARGKKLLQVERLDYLDVVDAESLKPLTVVDRPARAMVAAFVGGTRLIDNVAVGPSA